MQVRKIASRLAVAAAVLAAPAARAAEPAVAQPPGGFSGKTEIVAGPALQVIFGERAVFHLDEKGEPTLEAVEKGALAMAHPAGQVKESFAAPGPGKLAIALDGSPEKRASYLKIWNGLDHPVLYRAVVLALQDGALKPVVVKVCAAPAGGVASQSWPAPLAAVAVAGFTSAPDDKTCK